MSGGNDWAPGDYALCVHDRLASGGRLRSIRAGGIYVVREVGTPRLHEDFGNETPLLLTVGCPSGYASSRFVKVTPGADITGKEVENKRPVEVGV